MNDEPSGTRIRTVRAPPRDASRPPTGAPQAAHPKTIREKLAAWRDAPEILSATALRSVIVPRGRTVVDVTVGGWGWLRIGDVSTFFRGPTQKRVLLPVGRVVAIHVRNPFGQAKRILHIRATEREAPAEVSPPTCKLPETLDPPRLALLAAGEVTLAVVCPVPTSATAPALAMDAVRATVPRFALSGAHPLSFTVSDTRELSGLRDELLARAERRAHGKQGD